MPYWNTFQLSGAVSLYHPVIISTNEWDIEKFKCLSQHLCDIYVLLPYPMQLTEVMYFEC